MKELESSQPYVPNVLVPFGEGDPRAAAWMAELGENVVTESDVASGSRTVIRGAPGSGKTQLLQEVSRLAPRDEIVVFISLSRLQPLGGDPAVLLERWGDLTPGALSVERDMARYHFLLDGLDEMAPPDQDRLAQLVDALVPHFPQHRFTITARPVPALGLLPTPPWRHLALVPGGDWQNRFLGAHGLAWNEIAQVAPSAITDMRELFFLPFFLSHLVALHRDGELSLIRDLWGLVQRLVDQALSHERARDLLAVHPEEARGWLRRAALSLLLQSRTSASLDELEGVQLPGPSLIGDISELCNALVFRTMLAEEGGRYSFVHRIIGEALAAEALAELGPSTPYLLDALVPELTSDLRGARADWLVPLTFVGLRSDEWRNAVRLRDPLAAARMIPTEASASERTEAANLIWNSYLSWRVWMFEYNDPDLVNDSDALVRLIRGGGLTDVVERIRDGLEDESPQVRVNALRVLAALEDQWLIPRLREVLADQNGVVRRQGAVVAERLKRHDLVPDLLQRLLDSSDEVEDQDVGHALAALARDDELISLAAAILDERPSAHWPLWFLEQEITRRLETTQQLAFFRTLATRGRDSDLYLRLTVRNPLAQLLDNLRGSPDAVALEEVGYIAAVWELATPSLFNLLSDHPAQVLRGMLHAVAEGDADSFALARYIGAVPLEVLREVGAPSDLIEWKERASLESRQDEPRGTRGQPKSKTLAELLNSPEGTSESVLLRHSQTLAAQARALGDRDRVKLNRLLDRWKPTTAFSEAIWEEEPGSWRLDVRAAAWLNYGPALNLKLNPIDWVELASTGIVLGDGVDWLRQQWKPDVIPLVLSRQRNLSLKAWALIFRAAPRPVPSDVAWAAAANALISKEDDAWYIKEIAELLLEDARYEALNKLAAPAANSEALQPFLARAGDPNVAEKLLRVLNERLGQGEHPDRETVSWLDGVNDESLLPILFECLVKAAAQADRDPFGPIGAIQAAIARIDGEAAVRLYDEVLAEEPFDGAQFFRSQRDALLQEQLRAVGVGAAAHVLDALDLPSLDN